MVRRIRPGDAGADDALVQEAIERAGQEVFTPRTAQDSQRAVNFLLKQLKTTTAVAQELGITQRSVERYRTGARKHPPRARAAQRPSHADSPHRPANSTRPRLVAWISWCRATGLREVIPSAGIDSPASAVTLGLAGTVGVLFAVWVGLVMLTMESSSWREVVKVLLKPVEPARVGRDRRPSSSSAGSSAYNNPSDSGF
ncbi:MULTISPECIES: hypothetical protein [Streptomyces]|uniref:Uncharacterized protein n=1 Tax=Streptomyces doebereineriae TaxID=3075528 RepID=A0ABU2VGA5_9ACTN|nr:hypothetical protein [Streptomyces sp. DSM 41640]MDT0484610.1 hypothetical protein [Streptomyces sp. DSM 41640]